MVFLHSLFPEGHSIVQQTAGFPNTRGVLHSVICLFLSFFFYYTKSKTPGEVSLCSSAYTFGL